MIKKWIMKIKTERAFKKKMKEIKKREERTKKIHGTDASE